MDIKIVFDGGEEMQKALLETLLSMYAEQMSIRDLVMELISKEKGIDIKEMRETYQFNCKNHLDGLVKALFEEYHKIDPEDLK